MCEIPGCCRQHAQSLLLQEPPPCQPGVDCLLRHCCTAATGGTDTIAPDTIQGCCGLVNGQAGSFGTTEGARRHIWWMRLQFAVVQTGCLSAHRSSLVTGHLGPQQCCASPPVPVGAAIWNPTPTARPAPRPTRRRQRRRRTPADHATAAAELMQAPFAAAAGSLAAKRAVDDWADAGPALQRRSCVCEATMC